MANSFRVALHLKEFTAFSQLPFHPLSFIFLGRTELEQLAYFEFSKTQNFWGTPLSISYTETLP